MARTLYQETENYRLGVWNITEETEELAAKAGIPFPPVFRNEARIREHLAVRALAASMGIPVHTIAYQDNGKPYLTESDETISISHTKGYAAVLLSSHGKAGIDIEQRTERVVRVQHKFMHPEEWQWVKQPSGQQTDLLLLHWCAKEAMFKSLNQNGVDFAQDLRIEPFEYLDTIGHFKARAVRSGIDFYVDFRIEDDYVLTCCIG